MSELERRDTRAEGLESVLIPHAIQERPSEETPREAPFEDDGLRIGFLGRNIPKKGIHLIVSAIGRNPDRKWELSIAGPSGPGEYRQEIEDLVQELRIEDRVTWVGFLPRREDLLASCDVLAMPSAYEGFGMVAGEALCRGVPVIVPRLSGVAEIVSEFDAGIVMEESSVEEVEKALFTLDDARERYEDFSRNGLTAANMKLTYEAYATSTAALYASLLA